MAMTDTKAIRAELALFTPDATIEKARNTWLMAKSIKAWALQLDRDMQAQMLEWLQQNRCDLTIGELRLYAGSELGSRDRNPRATAEAILEAVSFDLDLYCTALSAGAHKPGESRKLLGERFGEFFEETRSPEVKEGKASKKVVTVNTRYAGAGRPHGEQKGAI